MSIETSIPRSQMCRKLAFDVLGLHPGGHASARYRAPDRRAADRLKSVDDEKRKRKAMFGVGILGMCGIIINLSFGIFLPSLQFFVTQDRDAIIPGVGIYLNKLLISI